MIKRTYLMIMAYDGTDFHGLQSQPGVRTVQSVLEEHMRRVLRHPVNAISSGRTDSGVHAQAMPFSFETTVDWPIERFAAAIGSRLPDDLGIVSVEEVRSGVNARFDAIGKHYCYRIWNHTESPVKNLVQRYAYHFWRPVDVEAMRRASSFFVGEHDFQAMAGAGCQRKTTIREVTRCDVERVGDELQVQVEGTGFLYKQVRNMVGTLLAVGQGRIQPEYVGEILKSCDRRTAGPTAPALGLTLMKVFYPPDIHDLEQGPWERAGKAGAVADEDGAE